MPCYRRWFLDGPELKLRNLLQSVVIIICMLVLLLETLIHWSTLKESWPELAVAERVPAWIHRRKSMLIGPQAVASC